MTDSQWFLEVFVEEPSAREALRVLLPKIVPGHPVRIVAFNGKHVLLSRLPDRFRVLSSRMRYENVKIVVLVDRDDDDCLLLKERLNKIAGDAALRAGWGDQGADVVNRIVVDELEAWYFGDIPALRMLYPRLSPSLGEQVRYRDPDGIKGGTWEALDRLLVKHGYGRLNKFTLASRIAAHMDVEANRSRSFQVFRDGIRRLVSEDAYA